MHFEQLTQTCEQAHNYLQGTAVSVVNQSLTIRNWLFGHYIVEYEQNGEDRAKYGDQFLAALAKDLKSKGIKGLSKRNLHYFCQFYLMYPATGQLITSMNLPRPIVQTLSAQSETTQKKAGKIESDPQVLISRLSFSHIIELMGEKDPIKRIFYEVQAIKGNWSVRQLKRQMDSLLYERTGLSTDKKGLIQDLLQGILPRELIRRVHLDTLEYDPTEYVDRELDPYFRDITCNIPKEVKRFVPLFDYVLFDTKDYEDHTIIQHFKRPNVKIGVWFMKRSDNLIGFIKENPLLAREILREIRNIEKTNIQRFFLFIRAFIIWD